MPPCRIVVIASFLLTAGCASVPESDQYAQAGPVQTLSRPDLGSDPVTVVFPAGALVIRGVEGNTLTAELMIRCPAGSETCIERADKVTLASADDNGGVRVVVDNAPLLRMAKAQLELTVGVPDGASLAVDFRYGDLDIRDVSGCLTVDMSAGDANITVPIRTVASVRLDAGTGDAALITPAGTIEGRRSWLVGAEVEWAQGPGSCHLDVDVNAGAILVRLE